MKPGSRLPPDWRRALWVALVLMLIAAIYAWFRFTRDEPVVYQNIEDHFKYGSTGGERGSGIPYSIWKVLPEIFPQYLPGNYNSNQPFAGFGFIYEPGRDLPVGVSKRNVQGLDRVFFNCAICHVGTVRDNPESQPRIILGMPANVVDLQAFERFLFNCAVDENFTAQRFLPEITRSVPQEDWLNRQALRFIGISLMRDRMIMLRDRFKFQDREPDCGPGRVDTFNPPKVLLNFRMDLLPASEWVGNCDLPSIWHQDQRVGMWLHWDGNNNSVEERNRSAAFGTGATPPTLDRDSLKRTVDWLYHGAAPPPYPYPIDKALAQQGALIYEHYCAACHGRSGTDFKGQSVGQVTPIEKIKTDRARLDSYSSDLCANQNLLYAGYGDERFSHFRKTFGYANSPLDGVWLRAPFLHNGSVPTLRDLLEPAANRPKIFYRGYDVYDPKRVGFITSIATEGGRKYFRFDTSLPGNGNAGHEGAAYGTSLGEQEKEALMEYLKTF
jgi:mono/diheme cytochrome c family protein